jgi:F0F1-type ATP synthase assembly protein I
MSSIILGTLASLLPNLVFYKLFFLQYTATHQRFIKFIYLCEGLKFAGMAFLFSVFLQWPGLQVVKFFSSFMFFELVRVLYLFYKLTRTSA